jgi:hypothetical protein
MWRRCRWRSRLQLLPSQEFSDGYTGALASRMPQNAKPWNTHFKLLWHLHSCQCYHRLSLSPWRPKHTSSSCETNMRAMEMNRLRWYGHQHAIMNLLGAGESSCHCSASVHGRLVSSFRRQLVDYDRDSKFSAPWASILFHLTGAHYNTPDIQSDTCPARTKRS